MTERPILFSTPMVKALLDGRKTQTRRIVYKERLIRKDGRIPASALVFLQDYPPPFRRNVACYDALSPLASTAPGDTLWVREGFCYKFMFPGSRLGAYRADNVPGTHWKPGIHMPRRFSRITLKVTATRIERLQDISEADARAEGVSIKNQATASVGGRSLPPPEVFHFGQDPVEGTLFCEAFSARGAFELLWASLHGSASWDRNPWVVVITTERIRP